MINAPLLRNNRALRFKEENNSCQECGKSAKHIHHKDKNRNNHTLKNLRVLCVLCHDKKHIPGYHDPLKNLEGWLIIYNQF